MDCKRIDTYMDRAAFVVLCALMVDCSLLGTGKLLRIGPVSLRMALFAMLVVLTLPQVFRNFKALVSQPMFLILAGFLVWCAVATGIGFARGNRTDLILTDIKGFCYFAALPGIACLLRTKKRMRILAKAIWAASLVLALFGFIMLLGYVLHWPFTQGIARVMNDVGLGTSSRISSKITRYFFRSCVYMIAGLVLSVFFSLREEKPLLSVLYAAAGGLQAFALWISYTRSIYFGAFVAGLLFCVLCMAADRRLFKRLCGVLACVLAAFLIFGAVTGAVGRTDYVSYGVRRVALSFSNVDFETLNPDELDEESYFDYLTLKSDKLRRDTKRELKEGIMRSPLFGNGLGASIPVREDGLNEYFFLDLTYKTGIVGLLLYLLPFCRLLFLQLKRRKQKYATDMAIWTASLAGFMTVSYFNPYMNAALGILLYGCAMALMHNFCLSGFACAHVEKAEETV